MIQTHIRTQVGKVTLVHNGIIENYRELIATMNWKVF